VSIILGEGMKRQDSIYIVRAFDSGKSLVHMNLNLLLRSLPDHVSYNIFLGGSIILGKGMTM
jgi:hypothetical protein